MGLSLRDSLRKYRNAFATWFRRLSGGSDRKRWADLSAHSPEWDERNRLIAGLVAPGSSVLEFGAGRMVLRGFLPEGCRYTPSDIVDRGEGTIVCDLNAPELPPFAPSDVVVFSGVLEYVNDVPRLVDHLAGIAGSVIVSYVLLESYHDKIERRSHGWVNDYTAREIEAIFSRAGFGLESSETWKSHRIFRFVRRRG